MVTTIPSSLAMIIEQDELDVAPAEGSGFRPPQSHTAAAFVRALDAAADEARMALQGTTDDYLQTPWRLLAAGKVVTEAPRLHMLRDNDVVPGWPKPLPDTDVAHAAWTWGSCGDFLPVRALIGSGPGRRGCGGRPRRSEIMPITAEASVPCVDRASRIYTPFNISEQTGVSGFAFSRRLAAQTGVTRRDISRAFFQGTSAFSHAALAQRLASDSAGGPTTGENSIAITVSNLNATTDSEADYIWMYFGLEKRVKLLGAAGRFPGGTTLTWDLNAVGDWLEDNVTTDSWDEIALVTDFNDGMFIDRIVITHSGETILDWDSAQWLDGSPLEAYGRLVLTSKILETKLGQIDNLWVPQIHWAARELGKSDGAKYGTTSAWCSEFASWCLRKAMWDTPDGNISSQAIEDYFSDLGRAFTHDQLIDGDYTLVAGDYIRFEWANGGQHSGLFIKYIDDPASPSDSTTIQTIEGNASATVLVATREFQDILSVGNCQ